MNRLIAVATLSLTITTAVGAQSSSERSWDFEIQPYLIFASIEGDAGIGRVSSLPVDVDFGDILRNLELGGMVRGEAFHRESGLGLVVDYGFMDLASDRSLIASSVLSASVRQGILEGFVAYRLQTGTAAVVDLYAGVRWWDIDVDVALSPGPLSTSRNVDWIDPVLGIKSRLPVSETWSMLSRFDIGGFGVASDFTWNLALGARARLSDTLSLDLMYRALAVDYAESRGSSDFFAYDTITHGPLLGVSITF